MKDYYKILGVKETASADEIHDRWLELIQQFHPDHGIHGETDDEKAKEINEAYQVLKYSSTRMAYDFEKGEQKKLKKFPIPKFILPVSGLTFLLILSFMFLRKPQVPTPLNPKPQLPPSSQAEVSSIPPYEPSPQLNSAQSDSKLKASAKAEKVAPAQKGQDTRSASVVPKKKLEPPLQKNDSADSAIPLPSSSPNEPNLPKPLNQRSNMTPLKASEKVAIRHPISDSKPPLKVEARVPEVKPPSLIATEEEVRQFFVNYVERYNQKDVQGFLSHFSSKATQNMKDGLEGIRRIYENFFIQSQELRYRMEDTKIDIYENAVEVKARYEIDQILKMEEGKKIWRGSIHWILVKEEGVLKITSLNYQHDKSP
jgi:hypothetical protein